MMMMMMTTTTSTSSSSFILTVYDKRRAVVHLVERCGGVGQEHRSARDHQLTWALDVASDPFGERDDLPKKES